MGERNNRDYNQLIRFGRHRNLPSIGGADENPGTLRAIIHGNTRIGWNLLDLENQNGSLMNSNVNDI